jgi:hypothetical protein
VKLDEKTIRNEKKGADMSATGVGKSESFQQQGADQSAPAPSSPPRIISGAAAANLVHRREVGAAERKERVTEDEKRILAGRLGDLVAGFAFDRRCQVGTFGRLCAAAFSTGCGQLVK